jgi:hypothetical protein
MKIKLTDNNQIIEFQAENKIDKIRLERLFKKKHIHFNCKYLKNKRYKKLGIQIAQTIEKYKWIKRRNK